MARGKPRKNLRRRGPKREAYDRVLIVCEGERTEPAYFDNLARRYRLSSANIEVVGTGVDPATIVKRAKQRREREIRQGERYDQTYCVFDQDEHPTFDRAFDDARNSGLKLARSWPCFEFWLLLHFRYSRSPYTTSAGRGPCENCISDLRQHLPNYRKASRGIFSQLEERLEYAKDNAARALYDARNTGEFNPSTEIHRLVCYLQSIETAANNSAGRSA